MKSCSSSSSESGRAAPVDDQRRKPGFVQVLLPAKLICRNAEYFCLVRDISESGLRVKLFHPLLDHELATLEMSNGHCLKIKPTWKQDNAAVYSFLENADVARLIEDANILPRRQLRLDLLITGALRSGDTIARIVIKNMSQQGAGVKCKMHLAVGQFVMLRPAEAPEIPAKVRWRGDGEYGLLFERTFSLRDFAILANTLQ